MLGYNIYIIYMKQIFKPFFIRYGRMGKTKGFIEPKGSRRRVRVRVCVRAEGEGVGKGGVWV